VGGAGVDIFFVISGVVIAKTAPGMTSAQFLWRRIRRIMPIYLVACAPLLIERSGYGWRGLVATLLLWPATDIMTVPLLEVAWSLSFEMLFYLSAALVLYDRRWLYALLGMYVIAFALRPSGLPVFQFIGNPIVLEFLFGVAIAYAPMWRGAVLGIPVGFAVLAVSGLLRIAPHGGVLDVFMRQENMQRLFVYGLPSAMIVYGFMQIRARESVWSYLGDMSYSLYLFHGYSIALLHQLWLIAPIQPDLISIIGVAASVLFAWCIYVLIEKPILRMIPTTLTRYAPAKDARSAPLTPLPDATPLTVVQPPPPPRN
jgi:exopolysaccharide production protein ExoZ